MGDTPGTVRVVNHSTEDVGHNDEEIGGEGVALTQTSLAVDPAPWHTVKEDGRFPGAEKRGDPSTPLAPETSSGQNAQQAVPVN